MAALTEEQKAAMREASRSAAHALSDDLKHLREMLGKDRVLAGDLRRMSNELRRILVNGDLRRVAQPRVGRISIQAPQLDPYYRANEREPYDVFSGGWLAYAGDNVGGFYRSPSEVGVVWPEPHVPLNVEHFIGQRVVCLKGRWISRTDIIKYVGIVAHGIHSEDPTKDPVFEFVHQLKNYAWLSFSDGISMTFAGTDAPAPEPLRYEPDRIDIALAQLMSTAQYLVTSPEVVELERVIDEEC